MKTLKDIQEEVLKEFDEKFVAMTRGIMGGKPWPKLTVSRPEAIREWIASAGLTYARAAYEADEIEKMGGHHPESEFARYGWNAAIQKVEERKREFLGE